MVLVSTCMQFSIKLFNIITQELTNDGFQYTEIDQDRFPIQYDDTLGKSNGIAVALSGKKLGFTKFQLALETEDGQQYKELDTINVRV